MLIVLDTNIWISQLALGSSGGSAVRHFMRRKGATLVVPEIIKTELHENLTEWLMELRDRIVSSHRQLLTVFGTLPNISLPSNEQIEQVVVGTIEKLDVPTRIVPLTDQICQLAQSRVKRRIAPSEDKEQFGDTVIWINCMELLKENDVYLVSEDTGFYQHKDYKQGLKKVLKKEIRAFDNKLFLFDNLDQLLEEIEEDTAITNDAIVEAILDRDRTTIFKILRDHGFEICGPSEGTPTCFITEKANLIYFTFDLTQPCRDITGQGRRNGELKLKGKGMFNFDIAEIADVQNDHIRLSYPDWTPESPLRGVASVAAHFNAPAVHQVRRQLAQ